MVDGEAGIGKTTLLRAWAGLRTAADDTVLMASCGPLDRSMPLDALLASLASLLRELGPVLARRGRGPGRRRRVARRAAGASEPGGGGASAAGPGGPRADRGGHTSATMHSLLFTGHAHALAGRPGQALDALARYTTEVERRQVPRFAGRAVNFAGWPPTSPSPPGGPGPTGPAARTSPPAL